MNSSKCSETLIECDLDIKLIEELLKKWAQIVRKEINWCHKFDAFVTILAIFLSIISSINLIFRERFIEIYSISLQLFGHQTPPYKLTNNKNTYATKFFILLSFRWK